MNKEKDKVYTEEEKRKNYINRLITERSGIEKERTIKLSNVQKAKAWFDQCEMERVEREVKRLIECELMHSNTRLHTLTLHQSQPVTGTMHIVYKDGRDVDIEFTDYNELYQELKRIKNDV